MELRSNPFFKIGATTWDTTPRIMDLAEEKCLISDEESVREATAILTNPRRRLSAEIGWLPGIGPKRISEVLLTLDQAPAEVRSIENLPTLARANVLADGLVRVGRRLPQSELALWIVDLAKTHDEIEAEQTLIELNKERSVAGIPPISDTRSLDSEFLVRRRYYRRAIKSVLDELSAPSLVEVVTIVVDRSTGNGNYQAPILIDDLVDSYEVEAQEFLKTETENVRYLVQALRDSVSDDEDQNQVVRLVDQLEKVVKNWDRVAQPIQVSTRSRGTNHKLSHEIAGEIRRLGIDLFNEHGLLAISQRLTALLQEVFAEVDRVAEQSADDASVLEEIAMRRSQSIADMAARRESWTRQITYEAEVGSVFKEQLRISPNGVQWRGSRISLDEIKQVRWGGTRHSINDIPTGTTFHIFVGGEHKAIRIKIRDQQVYSEFISRLWKTAGTRLLIDMLEGLRAGKRYRFGTAVITDDGVYLERRRLLRENERVRCKWKDLVIGHDHGTFWIARKDDPKVTVELPYQDMDNVHILEVAMRISQKLAGPRLSDVLDMAD